MGLLKRISNFFWKSRDDPPHVARALDGIANAEQQHVDHDPHNRSQEIEEEAEDRHDRRVGREECRGGHRRGFSMPVYMAADKPQQHQQQQQQVGPLLVECPFKNGGVQGLDWCGQLLLVDEDGDVAHEFYEEKTTMSPYKSSKEDGGSMTLANHIAIEKKRRQQRNENRFIKVEDSVKPANVRRVDLRHGQVRCLIQDSDRKCHWA